MFLYICPMKLQKPSLKMKKHKKKSDTFISIKNFGSLGKEIKISPKTHVNICLPGYKKEFFVESVSVNIGIGKDHVAELIMPIDAWEALKKGEKPFTTTFKEFKKNFL